MHIHSDLNLWFSKIHAFFIDKDITADIVVKPVVGWKIVTFCIHHIQSHDIFIQYKPKMRFVKTCQTYIKMYLPLTPFCSLFSPF